MSLVWIAWIHLIPFGRHFPIPSVAQPKTEVFLRLFLSYIVDYIQKEFEVYFPQEVIDCAQVRIVKILKFVSWIDSVDD